MHGKDKGIYEATMNVFSQTSSGHNVSTTQVFPRLYVNVMFLSFVFIDSSGLQGQQ